MNSAGFAAAGTTTASTVPRFLEVGARWAWRFVGVCAAIAILVWATAALTVVVIPIFVAFILAALLTPLVDLVDRKMPRLLATWLVLLGVVAVLVGGGVLLARPISSATSELGNEFAAAFDDFEDWLRTGPLGLDQERIDSLFASVGDAGDRLLSGFTEQPASTARLAAEFVGGFFLTVVLTFFFLKDGRNLWNWVLGLVRPVRRQKLDSAGRASFSSLQGWIRGVAITGLADGLLIGIALVILGVPAAIPLAVITMVAAFLPIIGAPIAGALAVLVALASNGLTTALIVVAVVLAVQQIEGDVLLPLVMRTQVALHPIVILVALAIGGALAGIIGALVSVPIAAAGSAALAAVNGGFQYDERPDDGVDMTNDSDDQSIEPSVPPPDGADDDEYARGATTLATLLDRARREGFDAEFERVGDDGSLRCSRCGEIVDAEGVERVWSERLEGATDPADMMHVSALRCPECGGGGVFVAHFGPAADSGEAAILHALPDETSGAHVNRPRA
jgi:predicted PurR-regulated permease PerM/DNA-directed RNA polymerase subunit RPC12/RpoP